jgi:hypothetical protein
MTVPIQLFSAWMGPGPMSTARENALRVITMHCGVPLHFVSHINLKSWIHDDYPLHIGFPYLSAVHQCDYLRCYLLHVYGGGYTDIKPSTNNWNSFFSMLQLTKFIGAGYTEISQQSVAKVGGELEEEMKNNYQKLIGVCSLIMAPKSEFSKNWFNKVNNILDNNIEALIGNPARHPQDYYGANFQDGSISMYPIAWTGLGGDVLHPLIYENSHNFLHLNMAPDFRNYR